MMSGRFITSDRKGFTLIELMIAMAVAVFVITAASQILIALVNQFKQQGKIAETSIESVVGLEVLRRDIRSAGYGLFHSATGVNYLEAATNNFNANDAPSDPPRALASGVIDSAFTNTASSVLGSDYLVIKSVIVAQNGASSKSHTLDRYDNTNDWGNSRENSKDTDRVIVLKWRKSTGIELVMDSGAFGPQFSTFNDGVTDAYSPDIRRMNYTHFIYGADPDTALRFPFNRADYYVSTADVPMRCASGTGVLVKAVLDQADGNFDLDGDGSADLMPLLDCVADMQVVYRRDTDNNGTADTNDDDISSLSAEDLRDEVREVRVYILAHEGQRDLTYKYDPDGDGTPNSTVDVGEFGSGRDFDLTGITNYENYRWKVYTLVEKPEVLR
jgi:prepilin-type N-terminal cleavage/methylation domain-containing protein